MAVATFLHQNWATLVAAGGPFTKSEPLSMSDLSPLFSCTTTVCTAKPEDAGKQPFLMAQKPGTQ